MNDSRDRERRRARTRRERRERIVEWAEYVRTHPDDDWGVQVNDLVDAQIEAARRVEDHRPDPATLRDSPLLREANQERDDEGEPEERERTSGQSDGRRDT